MQRSYLVKSPVHFADFGFFVKVGDILVHDTSNANKLTVYRGGEVVKSVKQTALGLAAMQKSGFIEEVVQHAKTAPKAPQKPAEAPKPVPKREDPKPAPKPAPAPVAKKDEVDQKRKKAVPTEVPFEELPTELKAEIERRRKDEPKPKRVEIEDETV
jgi:hypothetical protein